MVIKGEKIILSKEQLNILNEAGINYDKFTEEVKYIKNAITDYNMDNLDAFSLFVGFKIGRNVFY